MGASLDLNKRIQCANPLFRPLKYILWHTTAYLSVDSLILQRLYANKHILNLNQAIAMRFSQNKAK